MQLCIRLIVGLALAVIVCHPHGFDTSDDNATPTVHTPPSVSLGPGLSLSVASREVVRRSLEESLLLQVFVQAKSASIDDKHWTVAPDRYRALSFAGILQAAGTRLQI